jgi:hypothetical protein
MPVRLEVGTGDNQKQFNKMASRFKPPPPPTDNPQLKNLAFTGSAYVAWCTSADLQWDFRTCQRQSGEPAVAECVTNKTQQRLR